MASQLDGRQARACAVGDDGESGSQAGSAFEVDRHDVRVLLDRSRLTQVREQRALVLPGLNIPRELREGDQLKIGLLDVSDKCVTFYHHVEEMLDVPYR